MALIKCPECRKEISDKSPNCIHCGFPLTSIQTNILKNVIIITPSNGYVIAKKGVSSEEALAFKKAQEQFGSQIEILDSNIDINEYYKTTMNTVRCPRCGSTVITTGARGVNWTLGLIGASKTVNRCGKCGHTWEPKRQEKVYLWP